MRPHTAICLVALGAMSCSNHTSGDLLSVPFSIAGTSAASSPMSLTTPLGWNVQLAEAKTNLGPFYFNTSPSNTSQFRSGLVIVQSLAQVTVDTLNPTLLSVTQGAQGETGQAVAVEIGLIPPSSSITDTSVGGPTGTSSAFLKGTASLVDGGTVVPFAGWITIDQNLATPNTPLPWLQRVNGAACDLGFVSSAQSLSLRVDPSHWFDSADFSQLLPPASADGGVASGPDGGIFTWQNTGPTGNFHQAVLSQIQGTTGVYNFELTGP